MFPILIVLEAVDGFEDGRCEPGARVEPHNCVVEGLLSGFVLLVGSFFHVTISLLELPDGMLGLFCG